MARLNQNFKNVPESYLFSEISKKTKAFMEANPGVEVLKLGLGNTTEPLAPSVVEGLKKGVEKLSKVDSYTGYGDEQGMHELREALAKWYSKRGIKLLPEEVFVSDGAKSDCANISLIFDDSSTVAIADPVYPVYLDANTMLGKKVVLLSATEETGFIPELPKEHADLIFLGSPNNPTGAVATHDQLKAFVDYAKKEKAVIVFDAAYSEYIQEQGIPRSIYEIEGAKECAIEIQSFSKSAGFTGVRLGWTVVPLDLVVEGSSRGEVNKFWNRRQTTMFNGASNISQEGGLAALTEEGQAQTREQVSYYMENARIIKEGVSGLGLKVFGGENAPYVWVQCPEKMSSWEFFDKILEETHVVTTPGSGFGSMGEGYIRFAAFGHRENIEKAVKSLKENLKLN